MKTARSEERKRNNIFYYTNTEWQVDGYWKSKGREKYQVFELDYKEMK